MEVIILKNYDEVSKLGAQTILNVIKSKKSPILGLATGSTPIGLYKNLIKDHKENNTSYKSVKTFNLDEYYGINKQHEKSYHYFMDENLFKHIDIKRSNINIPSGELEDYKDECERYNKLLSDNQIDIQLLGLGSNGHIGFNEPGTSFDSYTHFVKLDEKTRKDNARFFNSLDEVPTFSISMGIQNIMASKKILLLATGVNKAKAVKNLVEGSITKDFPASILKNHKDVTVLLDEEAASYLSKVYDEVN